MENAYTFPVPFYNISFPSPYSSCPVPGTPRSLSHVMLILFKFHSFTPSLAGTYYICCSIKKNIKRKRREERKKEKREKEGKKEKKNRKFEANEMGRMKCIKDTKKRDALKNINKVTSILLIQ